MAPLTNAQILAMLGRKRGGFRDKTIPGEVFEGGLTAKATPTATASTNPLADIMNRPVDPATGVQAPLTPDQVRQALEVLRKTSLRGFRLSAKEIRHLYNAVGGDLRRMSDPFLHRMIRSLKNNGLSMQQIRSDPAFMDYMASNREMRVGNRQNKVTDLSFIKKLRAVENDSFNNLITSALIASQAPALEAASGSGGGGGGGGGGYSGGGYSRRSYSSGSSGGDKKYGPPKTQEISESATEDLDQWFPGFPEAVAALGKGDPVETEAYRRLADSMGFGSGPNAMLSDLADAANNAQQAITNAQAVIDRKKATAQAFMQAVESAQGQGTDIETALRMSKVMAALPNAPGEPSPLNEEQQQILETQRPVSSAEAAVLRRFGGMPSALANVFPGGPVFLEEDLIRRGMRRGTYAAIQNRKALSEEARRINRLTNVTREYSPNYNPVVSHRNIENQSDADYDVPYNPKRSFVGGGGTESPVTSFTKSPEIQRKIAQAVSSMGGPPTDDFNNQYDYATRSTFAPKRSDYKLLPSYDPETPESERNLTQNRYGDIVNSALDKILEERRMQEMQRLAQIAARNQAAAARRYTEPSYDYGGDENDPGYSYVPPYSPPSTGPTLPPLPETMPPDYHIPRRPAPRPVPSVPRWQQRPRGTNIPV